MNEDRAPVVLTPEHVPVRLTPAGLGSRFLALIADASIILAVSAVLHMILTAIQPFGLKAALATTGVFVLTWGYHVFFEVRRQGQSPGKRLCGLRVVDNRGLPITFQQSFVRNIVRMLDFAPLFYGLGGLVSLLYSRNRRLGDIAADTLVIQEARPVDYTRQLADPLRFNSLRNPRVLRRIRHEIGLEEREFLLTLCLRAERMAPQARFDLMEDVGNGYRRTLGVDDPHLSGENLVRGLTAILFTDRA